MKKAVGGVLLCGLMCLQATAADVDVTNSFIKCARTKDSGRRLSCYDQIGDAIAKSNRPAGNASKSAYKPMALLDLKTDIKELSGKKVSVSGSLQMIGAMAVLRSDPMDMTPIMVNIDNLPRDDRKQALKGCLTYCGVQINGKVKSGLIGPGLEAEQIVWK